MGGIENGRDPATGHCAGLSVGVQQRTPKRPLTATANDLGDSPQLRVRLKSREEHLSVRFIVQSKAMNIIDGQRTRTAIVGKAEIMPNQAIAGTLGPLDATDQRHRTVCNLGLDRPAVRIDGDVEPRSRERRVPSPAAYAGTELR